MITLSLFDLSLAALLVVALALSSLHILLQQYGLPFSSH